MMDGTEQSIEFSSLEYGRAGLTRLHRLIVRRPSGLAEKTLNNSRAVSRSVATI
jgi:hypothetical protein